jgi:hydroxyacylglutathione hydrolase
VSTESRPVVERFTGGAFGENCFLVTCPRSREGLIVDPGAAVGELLASARRQSIQIVKIVLTHAHIDHVDGLSEAKRETSAPVLLHREAEPMYKAAPIQAQRFGLPMDPLPPIDDYLLEGDRIAFGDCAFEVRYTPGHAPGHVVLVAPGVALVGDCVFSGSIGRTDLPGGDFQTLMSSIRGKILTLPDDTVLHSGHGPETTVGHERRWNPFLTPQFGGSDFA